jgi:hypothetical protein
MHFSTSVLGSIVAFCATANAALTRVNDFGANPSNLQMNIYVPAKLATKPAIILAVRAFIPFQDLPNKACANLSIAALLRRYWRSLRSVHKIQQPS